MSKKLKLNKIDRAEARGLTEQLRHSANAVANRYEGVVAEIVGSTKYSATDITVTIRLKRTSLDGDERSRDQFHWEAAMRANSGLPPFGAIIELPNVGRVKLDGWNNRAHRYPILATMVSADGETNGDRYK